MALHRLLWFVGATAGGWIGWILGEPAGTMTAFLLSVVGTAIGVVVARRLADRLLS